MLADRLKASGYAAQGKLVSALLHTCYKLLQAIKSYYNLLQAITRS